MLDVSLFFHECSVFTSKLDPNYNLVYKFNCLFILSYYIVSLLDLVYFLFSYVNIRMIENKNVRAELIWRVLIATIKTPIHISQSKFSFQSLKHTTIYTCGA